MASCGVWPLAGGMKGLWAWHFRVYVPVSPPVK